MAASQSGRESHSSIMQDDDAALHGRADGQADTQADSSRCWHVSAQKGKGETLTAYGNTVRRIHSSTPAQWYSG